MNIQAKVKEWNSYYPTPPNKIRVLFELEKPQLTPTNTAMAHDFYYYSDEFSTLFDPLKDGDNVHLLLEGPHDDPVQGIRIPILSTWSHLRKVPWETGTQEAFAFYNNRWWNIKNINDTSLFGNQRSIITTCIPASGSCCWGSSDIWGKSYLVANNYAKEWHEHCAYSNINDYTIYNKVDFEAGIFYDLVMEYFKFNNPIVVDWLEERGDPLGMYLREVMSIERHYSLRELHHKCTCIRYATNYRSANLILLAKALMRL